MRRARRIARLMFPLVTVFAVATSSPSPAQCSYPLLSSGVAVYYPPGTVLFPTIVQSTNYWSAVAVRPDPGSDWDLSLNTTATAFPACVTGALASSEYAGSAVDVVVGDFNHNAQGTFYARPYLFNGPGGATVEWDDGADQLVVNGPWISRTTGPADVIECWDVFMEQGSFYAINLLNYGDASLRLLFFQSPSAPYWVGRSAATYETVPIANGSLSVGWHSNSADWLGVVVVNDNGLPADYKLVVTTCLPPTVLASATPVTVSSPERQYSFLQSSDYFTALGVRPNNLAEDWGIHTFSGPFDVTYGTCLQNELAISLFSPNKTQYIVGDFNAGANPVNTTYYARAAALYGTAGTAQVEWDDGPDRLIVDAPPIAGTTDSTDVLACWDVNLVAGQAYRFHFEHAGNADLKLGLFQNPGSIYWVPRSAAVEEHASSFDYTATSTDWHGVVVANDNGKSGTYELGVATSLVGVDDTPPPITRLEGVAPNPMVSGSHIRYALREAADVRFDVVDAAGRRVSRIEEGARAPGHWSTTWSGTNEDGRRLGAGMYFLRMLVDGRVVESSKIILLP